MVPYSRLLALEIRASRLGFAVLEGPTRLLDWGTRSFVEQDVRFSSGLSDRVATLIAFHGPRTVVVRVRVYRDPANDRNFQKLLSGIRAESRRQSAELSRITTDQVRHHFEGTTNGTKHSIASYLAQRFEELSWKLPHRRKSYESEAPAMVVFDALAAGIAFLEAPSTTFHLQANSEHD